MSIELLIDQNHQEGEFLQLLVSKPAASIVVPLDLDTAETLAYVITETVNKLRLKNSSNSNSKG